MSDTKIQPVHFLPMTFEQYVRCVYSSESGKLLHHEISVQLVPDGRVDLKPGDRVRVTIEKWEPR